MKTTHSLCCILLVALQACSEPIMAPGADDAGPADSGIVFIPEERRVPDALAPDNARYDSDCDGLSDQQEFATVWAGGKKTDPAAADSDGDGIPDGVEAGKTSSPDYSCASVAADADPGTRTDPTQPDSDCDALADGEEDANRNGRLDPGETDPGNPDSDADRLWDGLELGRTTAVANGQCPAPVADADPGSRTDPTRHDTDGDGIPDGREDRDHDGAVDLAAPASPSYELGDETDPTRSDSDGDGRSDGAEDANQNYLVDPGESDPLKVMTDADGDGVDDALEASCGYDPTKADSDGDGLPDALEDRDGDCLIEAGETDPRRIDSDCDGLADGAEDADHDGALDAGETDPALADTDGDGLTDGVELRLTAAADPAHCPDTPLDADPTNGTNPRLADTDGSGVVDGAEDTDKDGRLDPGELDPNDTTDEQGVVGQACASSQLTPLQFKQAADADSQLALTEAFADGAAKNLSALTLNGQRRGWLFVDTAHELGGFVIDTTATSDNAVAEELALRGATPCSGPSGVFQQIACLDNAVVQPFTSWDGFPAVAARYDWLAGSGDDLKGRLNRVARQLLGSSVQGLFADGQESGTRVEPWKLRLEILVRGGGRAVLVGALTPSSRLAPGSDPVQTVRLEDVTNGSALARLADATAVQCDVRASGSPKVDFLWVVDDSCSMAPHQSAVSRAASAFVAKLANSQVDFRVATMSTGYWQQFMPNGTTRTKNFGKVFPFTRDLAEFQSRLKQPCPYSPTDPSITDPTCIGDAQCTGTEKGVESVYDALLNPKNGATPLLPATETERPDQLRRGAMLVVVFVSDAGDQSHREQEYVPKPGGTGTYVPPSDANDGPWWDASLPPYTELFRQIAARPDLGGLMVGAILCSGNTCKESVNPSLYDVLVAQTSGVQGLITSDTSIDSTMQTIVDAAVGATGLTLSRPPISASLRVVQDSPVDDPIRSECPQPTPHDPVDGFDYDGATRRISFFGKCRPTAAGRTVAISYRYWISGDSGGTCGTPCPEPKVCDPGTGQCICPADCGSPAPGPNYLCDRRACAWACPTACGGACGLFETCKPETCSCECVADSTCAPGLRFDSSACACRCDASALACGEHHQPNLETCACECKPDCGCAPTERCQPSLCECVPAAN